MRAWWWLLGLMLGLVLGFDIPAAAQTLPARRTLEAFGYRHLVVLFGKDSVDVLVQSKPREELVKKLVLLWCQGSLPRPLVLYDSTGPLRVFPFATRAGADSLAAFCHLAIIGKPGIPLTGNLQDLVNASFVDKTTRLPPAYFCQRDYLGYYVRRNEAVVRYLKKQPWVDKTRVVVGGHSEGSSVAAHLAAVPRLLSRAVYLSGSPLGRELTKMALNPANTDSDGTVAAGVEAAFGYWQQAVDHPMQNECNQSGDSNRNIYSHGQSVLPLLLRAKLPIFVGYGSRDDGTAANNYLHLEAIRLHRTNLTFRRYAGREHSYFRLTKAGRPDYSDDYFSVVGREFLRWSGLLPTAPILPR